MVIPEAHRQCLQLLLQDGAQQSWYKVLLVVCVQHSDTAMLIQASLCNKLELLICTC